MPQNAAARGRSCLRSNWNRARESGTRFFMAWSYFNWLSLQAFYSELVLPAAWSQPLLLSVGASSPASPGSMRSRPCFGVFNGEPPRTTRGHLRQLWPALFRLSIKKQRSPLTVICLRRHGLCSNCPVNPPSMHSGWRSIAGRCHH